jgi:hypothetical protein
MLTINLFNGLVYGAWLIVMCLGLAGFFTQDQTCIF